VLTKPLHSHNYGIAGGFEDAAQVRAALEAGGQRYTVSFDLVVINPSFVTGHVAFRAN
jgi:hypothetical protein